MFDKGFLNRVHNYVEILDCIWEMKNEVNDEILNLLVFSLCPSIPKAMEPSASKVHKIIVFGIFVGSSCHIIRI